MKKDTAPVVQMKFRTPYNKLKPDNGISFEGCVSLTKQSFKEECDINNIVRKFETQGILPDNIRSNPQYGDFTNLPSYQESLNVVIEANERFTDLPAKVRKRFDNDPGKLIDFCQDPKNLDEMVELGLAKRPRKDGDIIETPPKPRRPAENRVDETKVGRRPEGETTATQQAERAS